MNTCIRNPEARMKPQRGRNMQIAAPVIVAPDPSPARLSWAIRLFVAGATLLVLATARYFGFA